MSVKISELPTQTAISGDDYLVGDNGTDTTYKFQVSVLESEVNAAIEQTASDAVASVNTAKTQAVSAVGTKGDEVLDSIPDDYTTLSNDVTQLKNDLTEVTGKTNINASAGWNYGTYAFEVGRTYTIINNTSSALNIATVTEASASGTQIEVIKNNLLSGSSVDYTPTSSANAYKIYCAGTGTVSILSVDTGINSLYADVDDLKDDVDNLNSLVVDNNIANATISGKYINPNTGEVANNSSFSATDYIDITQTEYILRAKGQTYGAFYDASNSYISGFSNNTSLDYSGVVTPPQNARYIRLSAVTANLDYLSLVESEEPVKELNSEISVRASNIFGLEISEPIIITVKPNGGGDYTTIKDALESITDSSPNKKYIVEFYGDGNEYDVTAEFTSLSGTVGLLVPPFTKLKGVGGSRKNILVARLDTLDQSFSTLNLYQTSELEGLTIIGFNTRYAVHDDFVSAIELGHNRYIKDVVAISEKTYYFRPWGAGIRSGMNWFFEDCIFKGNQSENEGSFSCHNNIGFTLPANITFNNCRCLSNWTNGSITWGMRFSSIVNNANGIINNVKLVGTKTNGLFFTEENTSAYGKGMLFSATGFANDTKTATISASDGADYSDRIDLI